MHTKLKGSSRLYPAAENFQSHLQIYLQPTASPLYCKAQGKLLSKHKNGSPFVSPLLPRQDHTDNVHSYSYCELQIRSTQKLYFHRKEKRCTFHNPALSEAL